MNNIRQIRKKFKISAKQLGQAIGKSQPTISKWETSPNLHYEQAKKIADYLKISVFEVWGKQPDFLPKNTEKNMVCIDIIDIKQGRKTILGHQLLSANILQNYTSSAPQNIKIYRLNDDSMSPTITADDMVWVDTKYTSPNSDGIYLMQIGEEKKLRRIQINPIENSGLIKADNSRYESFYTKDYNQIKVFGKVIFHIKKL